MFVSWELDRSAVCAYPVYMGRHCKESRRSYRKRRKRAKRAKKSVLQRGNQVCNTFKESLATTRCSSSFDSASTEFAISGVETLSHCATENSFSHPKDQQKATERTQIAIKQIEIKDHRRLPFNSDPLIVGLREYGTIKGRLSDILERNNSLIL